MEFPARPSCQGWLPVRPCHAAPARACWKRADTDPGPRPFHLAYAKIFERDGMVCGVSRVIRRWGRIYLFQVGLFLTTCAVVSLWTMHYRLQPSFVAPIINAPISGLIHGLLLQALPSYLDILPLYLVLFAAFPLIYFGLRRKLWVALTASATIWLAANLNPNINLPNWIDHGRWFFNPFAWQFLFTIGAALALPAAIDKRSLPRINWVVWVCIVYLGFAFLIGPLDRLEFAEPPPNCFGHTRQNATRSASASRRPLTSLSVAEFRSVAGTCWSADFSTI